MAIKSVQLELASLHLSSATIKALKRLSRKALASTGILSLVFLSGCVVAPMSEVARACSLLDIAVSEAEMAESWYLDAGKVLESCGVSEAKETAEWKACHARRRNGSTEDCNLS